MDRTREQLARLTSVARKIGCPGDDLADYSETMLQTLDTWPYWECVHTGMGYWDRNVGPTPTDSDIDFELAQLASSAMTAIRWLLVPLSASDDKA